MSYVVCCLALHAVRYPSSYSKVPVDTRNSKELIFERWLNYFDIIVELIMPKSVTFSVLTSTLVKILIKGLTLFVTWWSISQQ